MVSYTEFRDTVAKIQTMLTENTLKPLAYRHFKQDHGHTIHEVLPGDNFEYTYTQNNLSITVDTETRELYNAQYNGKLLTVNSIAENPSNLCGLGKTIHEEWFNTFGEITQAHQPNHPGNPPFSTERFEKLITELETQWNQLCEDPTVDDLLNAITETNYKLAMRFLGADNPTQVLDPTSGHELYNLFANGEINVVFQDPDFAVLKPEYNHQTRAEVQAQQRNAIRAREEVVIQMPDNPPEEAFVIGKDDTPEGLFIHSIDGTRLRHNQTVSKSYVQDVMGFDRDYEQADHLRLNLDERVRLQGDLAVEYVSSETVTDAGRCPIPIDNHYIALDKGVLAPGEEKTSEPITVRVPDGAYLNIAHDEHENVAVELDGGEHRFYLLPRGLQPEPDRPHWSETDM